MFFTTQELVDKYSNYSNPKAKINRLLHKQQLFSLSKGVYTDNKELHPFCVASILNGPSYISFHKALEYYGLIPEAVYTITCATFNKRKDRTINNNFCNFKYSDVASQVFYYGVVTKEINGIKFYIATREKALCDLLYKLPPVISIKQMKQLLFENLRIDEDDFKELNKKDIQFLAKHYHCRNIYFLNKLRSKYE